MTKTEKGLLVTYIMAILVSVGAFVMAAVAKDVSALCTVAVAWITETAVYSGFYAWKSKNENRQKYAMKWVREIKEEFPPEIAARFAEIVLKE